MGLWAPALSAVPGVCCLLWGRGDVGQGGCGAGGPPLRVRRSLCCVPVPF